MSICLVSSIPLLLVIISYISFVHTVELEPESLWAAINATLVTDKVNKMGCIEVVLYNDETEIFARQNYSSWDAIFIHVKGNAPDGFMADEIVTNLSDRLKAEPKAVKGCTTWRKGLAVVPCITVVSIVNTTRDVIQMKTESEYDMDVRKLRLSDAFTKLLRFRTPLHRRNLVLVRFGTSEDDFGQCHPSGPYLKYPRRLVPLFEQVLFDFFPKIRAIHAVVGKKVFDTRKEKGKFVWMCEEVIKRLEEEDSCKANATRAEECAETVVNGAYSGVGIVNCSSYTPRH